MAHLEELSTIKSKMSQYFLSDRKLVDLLTGKTDTPIPAMGLLHTQVFPYDWVDDTVTEDLSFLCFDVDVPGIVNSAVKDVNLFVWVFCHQNKMRTASGMLRDRIASRVDELLNGSSTVGKIGRVELKRVVRFHPAKNFYGRELQYVVRDFNRFGESL